MESHRPHPKFGWTEEKSETETLRLQREEDLQRTTEAFARLEDATKEQTERMREVNETMEKLQLDKMMKDLFKPAPFAPLFPGDPEPLWTPDQPQPMPQYQTGYQTVTNNHTNGWTNPGNQWQSYNGSGPSSFASDHCHSIDAHSHQSGIGIAMSYVPTTENEAHAHSILAGNHKPLR